MSSGHPAEPQGTGNFCCIALQMKAKVTYSLRPLEENQKP